MMIFPAEREPEALEAQMIEIAIIALAVVLAVTDYFLYYEFKISFHDYHRLWSYSADLSNQLKEVQYEISEMKRKEEKVEWPKMNKIG